MYNAEEEHAYYLQASKEAREANARAHRAEMVLTKVYQLIIGDIEGFPEEEIEFRCDQGSERREYEQGMFHGRLEQSRELYAILMEEENDPD